MHAVIYDAVWINSSVGLQQREATEARVGLQISAREPEHLHNNSCTIDAGRKHLFK